MSPRPRTEDAASHPHSPNVLGGIAKAGYVKEAEFAYPQAGWQDAAGVGLQHVTQSPTTGSTPAAPADALKWDLIKSGLLSPTPSPRPDRPGSREDFIASVVAGMIPRLTAVVDSAAATGTPLPPAEELVELISVGLPHVREEGLDPYYARVGPFYDTEGARLQLRGITKQAVDQRRKRGAILAMQTVDDGRWLYPAWQFTGRGALHPELIDVVRALHPLNGWVAAVWLVSEHPDLEGRSPRSALANGIDPAVVARLAARDRHVLGAA